MATSSPKNRAKKSSTSIADQLKASEVFYRHLVEESPEAVVVHSFGEIVYINPAGLKFIGAKTPDQVLNKQIMEFVHPDSRELIMKRVQDMLSNRETAPIVEEKFVSFSGETLIAEVKAVPFIFQDNPAILVIIHDITKRKKAEARDLQRQATMEFAQRAGKLGTFEWDLLTGHSEGTKEFQELYGIQKGYIGGDLQKWTTFIHPDDRKNVAAETKRCIESKDKEFNVEFRVIWPDRSIHYLQTRAQVLRDETGNALKMIGATIDITKRKQAEENVMLAETRFRKLIENSADAIALIDGTGKLTYASQSVQKVLGYTDKEFLGLSGRSLIYPEDLAQLRQLNKALSSKPFHTVPIELRLRHKDETWRWIECSVTNLLQEPAIEAYVANFRDITERKMLEQQKDDFLGIASHELKTPVTSLKAFAQVLQTRFEKAGDMDSAKLLGKMDAQINKLTNLIGDLLDISKIEGGRLQFHDEEFKFSELVDEIIEEMQRTTEKHALIKKGETAAILYGDRERIGQVLTNFLTNAIKYSPHSDKIIIHLSSTQKEITVRVEDFGIGIPDNAVSQVFNRFYRVKGTMYDTIPGMGLGLYISSEIIKRQGGKIWVESTLGKGSSFCFSLPLKAARRIQQTNRLLEAEIRHE